MSIIVDSENPASEKCSFDELGAQVGDYARDRKTGIVNKN